MQFHWSDSDLRNPKDGCESLAPYVMALFDGEASEDQAKRARAHLLVCQTCAHRWLDWNRSRDLLRTVDVPAPPPTLLWRVLMACRLAAFARQGSAKSRSKVAPSQSISQSSGAPDALSAQIFARTTRVAAPSPVMKSRRTFPVFSLPSMAVPAMALWLIVLQRDSFFVAQLSSGPSELTQSVPAQRDSAQPSRSGAVKSHVSTFFKKLVAHPMAAHSKAADEEDEPLAPERAIRTEEADEVRVTREHFVRSTREEARGENEARTPRIVLARAEVERGVIGDTRSQRDGEMRPVDLTVAAAPRPAMPLQTNLQAQPSRLRTISPAPRLATLSGAAQSPHLRTAKWEGTVPRVTRIVDTAMDKAQKLRVSLPSSKASMPTPTRLLAENFENDDARVDEMRSVVDDFRATLAPDTTTDTDTALDSSN